MRTYGPADRVAGLLVAASVLVADQVSKLAALSGRSTVAWPARNPDYAFGIIGGPATMLVIGALLVLAAFLVLADALATRFGISVLLPALVAGGAVGNTLDRIRLGSVRDFLVTPWAIVNIADLAVAVGVVGITLALMARVTQVRAEFATSRAG